MRPDFELENLQAFKTTQLTLYTMMCHISLKSWCYGNFLYISANMQGNMTDFYKFRMSRPQILILWRLTHEQLDRPTQTFRSNSNCNKIVKLRIINVSCVHFEEICGSKTSWRTDLNSELSPYNKQTLNLHLLRVARSQNHILNK
jgi:hypothetical protein